MKEWLLGLWQSETKFRAFVRTVVALLGVVITAIPDVPQWIGLAVMAFANFIAAGERNAEPVTPAEAGVQRETRTEALDSGLRRNDDHEVHL